MKGGLLPRKLFGPTSVQPQFAVHPLSFSCFSPGRAGWGAGEPGPASRAAAPRHGGRPLTHWHPPETAPGPKAAFGPEAASWPAHGLPLATF